MLGRPPGESKKLMCPVPSITFKPGAGLVAGHLGALWMTRAFASLFEGAASLELTSLLAAAVVLFGAAVLAAAGPAWRATAIDPVSALRCE